MLFQVRFIALVPEDGRKTGTCALDVVPPVIVFAKTLLRTSMPVRDDAVIANAAESWPDAAVPNSGPNRLTELW